MNHKTVVVVVLLIIICCSSLLSGCLFSRNTGRLSGTVLFSYTSPAMKEWLDHPGKSYVQAYFLFPDDFASDIIFGIDQEFIEGVDDPIHFPGADWMALVGLTRDGILNVPVGTNESLNGTPSDASVWEHIDLNITLQPNTWYFMREVADFNNRTFESFTLQGPDVNSSVDLSEFYVDYPNYIPIDQRSMTYYVYAVRTYHNMQPGSTIIYFDDVEAGISSPDGFTTVLKDGFEKQNSISDLPLSLPVTPLNEIRENYWYKENDLALLSVTTDQVRTGDFSCACDVTFKGLRSKQPLFSFLSSSILDR